MHTFRTQRRVEFVDTDMEGIVHFSRFLIYMETAEHEFLEALGTSVATTIDGVRVGWPRVSVSCEYKRPARFRDDLDIVVTVERKGNRSMTYGFRFEKDGELIALGRSTCACCSLDGGGLKAIRIPKFLADQIEEVPR